MIACKLQSKNGVRCYRILYGDRQPLSACLNSVHFWGPQRNVENNVHSEAILAKYLLGSIRLANQEMRGRGGLERGDHG